MTRLIFTLVLAIAVTSTCAMAQSHQRGGPAPVMYLHNGCFDPKAAGYFGYNPCNDPNAVFVGGTYVGSDPDPNIRAALIREFGRFGRGR